MVELILFAAVLVAAMLYASVGHGGASAYIAILALAGLAQPEIAATVLLMNIVVSSIAFRQYQTSGHFDARTALVLIAFSAPAAFIGGLIPFSERAFSIVVGIALLVAAARLIFPDPVRVRNALPHGSVLWVQGAGMGIPLGLLAGVTGVGGGIYLSPILMLLGWKDARGTAAIASCFILVNSSTGLAGRLISGDGIELALLPLVAAAISGGYVGSRWGSRYAGLVTLRRLLGFVLIIAGAKLLGVSLAGW